MGNGWVDDEALEALKMESAVFGQGLGSQSNADISQRLMDENVVGATMSIIHIARHAEQPQLRFNAAKYVVDRVLGSVGKDAPSKDKDPLEALVEELRGLQ